MQHHLESIHALKEQYHISSRHYDRAIALLSYKKTLSGQQAYQIHDMHQLIFQEDYYANIAAVLKYHEQLIQWGFTPSDIIHIASHHHAHVALALWIEYMFSRTPTTPELLGLYYLDVDLSISHIVHLLAHHHNLRNWRVMVFVLTFLHPNTHERVFLSQLHPQLTLDYIIEWIQYNHHDDISSLIRSFECIIMLLHYRYEPHALRQISYRDDGVQRLEHLLQYTKQHHPDAQTQTLLTEVALTYRASEFNLRCQEAITLHALSTEEWKSIHTNLANEEHLDDDCLTFDLSF